MSSREIVWFIIVGSRSFSIIGLSGEDHIAVFKWEHKNLSNSDAYFPGISGLLSSLLNYYNIAFSFLQLQSHSNESVSVNLSQLESISVNLSQHLSIRVNFFQGKSIFVIISQFLQSISYWWCQLESIQVMSYCPLSLTKRFSWSKRSWCLNHPCWPPWSSFNEVSENMAMWMQKVDE